MMTRILLVFLLLLGWSGDVAAQTHPTAFTIPAGRYEYRWRMMRQADGSLERTPARGYLRLQQDGRFTHSRQDPALLVSRESGGYDPHGNVLHVRRVIPTEGRTVTDTFVVRNVGDRLFLLQKLADGGWVDYELAREGAPERRNLRPWIAPSIFGYVGRILYFAADDQPDPDLLWRPYATMFRSADTRFIYLQFQLVHPTTEFDGVIDLYCRVLRSSGEVAMDYTLPVEIRRGSATTYTWFRWGRDEPGFIRADTYRVECELEGARQMDGTFLVTG